MAEQSVVPLFDKLLAEIEEWITSLNVEGGRLFSEGEYDQARALLDRVESITGFRGKVICLRDEWKLINTPINHKGPPSNMEEKRTKSKFYKAGSGTSSADFRYPILEALFRLGGSGSVQEVLAVVGEIMAEDLNIHDFHPLPSKPDSVRWKNTAQWERFKMVQEGLLASDSERGIWEITETGQAYLDNAGEQSDQQPKLISSQ